MSETSPQQAILADYALAIHSTLLEGGGAPFDLAGIQVFDALSDIVGSSNGVKKRAHPLLGCLL